MRVRSTNRARRLCRLGQPAALFFALAFPARADLEVAIPPGSPLIWSRSFPALTPFPGPSFGGGGHARPSNASPSRTEATRRLGSEAVARVAAGLGLLRITTWDLASHVSWVQHIAGPSGAPIIELRGPRPGDGSYWVSVAALMRLMLHRSLVPEPELFAHVLEIGDGARVVLAAAKNETSLRRPVADLIQRLGPESPPLPVPTAPAKTRDELLDRFVREELLRYHPFDPEGAFGRRLFLLGGDLEPHVARLTRSEHALVRRNATAALGRYATASAERELVALASTTEDDVVLVRALAALSASQGKLDWTPLVARWSRAEDPVEIAALAGALSQRGVEALAPRLLQLGHEELAGDPDQVGTALAALARLRLTDRRDAALAFARDVESKVRANPRSFRPERPEPSAQPDFPDGSVARGRGLVQLALMLRARLTPTDDAPFAELLEMRVEKHGGAETWRVRESFVNAPLRGIVPEARFLFVETLLGRGDAGLEVLREIAGDGEVDPMLRAAAALELSWNECMDFAVQLLDTSTDPALRALGLHFLFLGYHPDAPLWGRRLLAECARTEPGAADGGTRRLWCNAVRLLSERRLATADDLVPLLSHVTSRVTPGPVLERTLSVAGTLVELAAEEKAPRVEATLDELLDYVEAHRMNPRLVREDAERDVRARLDEIDVRQRDPEAEARAVETIVEDLVGHAIGRGSDMAVPLAATVPLEEEILLALGRTKDERAELELVALLGDAESPHRAAIAVAIGTSAGASAGASGGSRGTEALVRLLLDPDPLTRLCAYEALRHLTGEDHFADWLDGSVRERSAAAEAYFGVVAKGR